MIPPQNYVMDRALLDTIIGRRDLPTRKRHQIAQQYAEALMNVATQQVDEAVSKRTIQQNVVRMITPNGLSASGVMVTQNGFFISAYHAIRGFEETFVRNSRKEITKYTAGDFVCEDAGYFVIDQQNKLYSLDTSFLMTDTAHDLALFKAIKPGKSNALPFNTSNREVEKDEQLLLMGMKSDLYIGEAKIITENPHVTFESCGQTIKDLFWAEGYAEPGHSGGVIIDQAGSLHGIIKARFEKRERQGVIGIPSIYLSYCICLANF